MGQAGGYEQEKSCWTNVTSRTGVHRSHHTWDIACSNLQEQKSHYPCAGCSMRTEQMGRRIHLSGQSWLSPTQTKRYRGSLEAHLSAGELEQAGLLQTRGPGRVSNRGCKTDPPRKLFLSPIHPCISEHSLFKPAWRPTRLGWVWVWVIIVTFAACCWDKGLDNGLLG